jgi:hypothetical protein
MNIPGAQVGQDEPVPGAFRTDRRVARLVFVFIIAAILAGFAKNFYLRAWLGTRPLIPTAWLHGIVMSAWLMLFAIQIVMVAHRRVDLHRKLGTFGAALAMLIVAVGILTIVVRARIVLPDASLVQYLVVFVAFDGLSLMLFGVLVTYALRLRARPDLHRRLMTMAMVALLPPAFGRLVAYVTHNHVEITVLGLMLVTVLLCVVVDSLRSGRIRGASLVPGLFIVLVNLATYFAQVAA